MFHFCLVELENLFKNAFHNEGQWHGVDMTLKGMNSFLSVICI